MAEVTKVILTIILALSTSSQPKEDVKVFPTYELNYTVDTSNSMVNGNTLLGYKLYDETMGDGEGCTKEIVDEILSDIEFNYDRKFKVHLINRIGEIGELAYIDRNIIVILDSGEDDTFEMYENTVLHELGHLVYYDLSRKQIAEWKEFRGIPKEWNDYSDYELMPTEIFARDFSYLFGSKYKSESYGFHYDYTSPAEIEGLKEYVVLLGKNRK